MYVLQVEEEEIVEVVLPPVRLVDQVEEDLILVVQGMYLLFHLHKETQQGLTMVAVAAQVNGDTVEVVQVEDLVLVEEATDALLALLAFPVIMLEVGEAGMGPALEQY
jgi:hypothetical protein